MLFRKERWRIAQHKIAKRTRNIDSFFTLAMLNAVIVVGKGIKGASPYRSEELMAERQSTFIKGRVAGDHSAVQISTANPLSSLETRNSNPSPTVPMVYEQEKE
jgi:hypothetical protein